MVKKSLLWGYRTALWLIGIIIFIFVIAALVIQFFVFPNINQYKDTIAKYATNAANQKVLIGSIKAGWQGINPNISLTNIDIYDAQNRPALQLKNTDVSFSWLSIPLLEPHLANFTIHSPELTIRRNLQGEFFVAGISMQGQSQPDLPNWLLRQSQFEVLNAKVTWVDEMRSAPALSLDKLNLHVVSPPWKSFIKNHRVTLSAVPSTGTNEPILVNANLYGNDISRLEQWHGSLQIKLKNADIVAFKPWLDYAILTQPIRLQSGIGSTDTTIQFAKNQVQSVTSSLALNNVTLQLKADAEPLVLNKLEGELDWSHLVTEQSLKVNGLTLQTSNGLSLQNAAGAYSKTKEGVEKFNIKLAHIDLAFIKTYLVQLPFPTEISQKINSLSPCW